MSQKKQIFKLSILRKLLSDANSCVSLVPSTRLLALPPFFLNDMKSGIFYFLNNILKKYDRSLEGIVIGYQNVKILMDENTGIIPIGSAETEVNVSVEFYIFQPKIGNTLEGIVNKKSNNHIGCLVHKYFNATILKPEDVEYKDWNCKDLDVNDTIVFQVKDLDFTGLLPYIEGIVRDEDMLYCVKSKKTHGCDLDVQKKILLKSTSPMDSSLESKKDDSLVSKTNESLNNTKSDESHGSKKKKKKKKKRKKEEEEVGELIFEKFLDRDSDDSSFVKPVKRKKEKKSKKEEELLRRTSEVHAQQEEFFYSTQLEPSSVSKMNASCSPIPKGLSCIKKEEGKTLKRGRKRKAEESEDGRSSKRAKKDVNEVNGISEFVDELLRQELNNVKKELKKTEKEAEMEKGENESLYEKLMKDVKKEIDCKKTKDTSKKNKKKKKEKEPKLKNGSMYDVDWTPEKVNAEKSLFSDSEQSRQSPFKKKNVNGVASTKKSFIQTMLDQFFKEEGKKLKSDQEKESEKNKMETEESLYEKLLSEAKRRIELPEDSPPKKKRKMK